VTFHTLRHSAATLLAELEVAPEKRQATLGHTSLETTALYTHRRPEAERPVVETLSEAWPIADLVTAPRMRASRKAADPDRPSSPHRSPHTRRGDRPVDSL
jgi:hypothetical protein